MNTRNFLASIVATSMVALPGCLLAQTATAITETETLGYFEIGDDATIIAPFNLTIEELDDYDVIGSTGEKFGEIEDFLTDASGEPVAVVIETEGFLGIGDEDVIVTLDQLELVDGKFQINLTEEGLEALPKWDD
ncbi:PRC-barrel domain-containing protein [Sulfitobacter sp. 916]|jgi:sporulation protein YlmC with PRC-barrel domain|uniref:PRC-barrel domain-containing protein n=1 Tax=Sulfitobacter sp. 916 TaxID=3368559 RepID=UPI003746879A